MEHNNLPEGDRIYDLYTGVYKPQIIRVALELDVFSLLDDKSEKAEAIAHACKCETTGIMYLMDYLTSLNILVKQDDKYSLSPEAATFLVKGKKTYTGDLIMDFIGSAPWESLRESIQSGLPKKIDLEIHFAQDAWIESYRAARIPSSLAMWEKVGIAADESLQLRLLDLACGCGIKSMVLAQKSKNVIITCLDTPMVLEVARNLAERWGIESQVSTIVGDLLSTDLGKELYDACLLGQITHYMTQQQNCKLFNRIYQTLVPGGKLVLDVPMTTSIINETSSFLSLLLWANSGGRAYSFDEYRSWLEEIGFIRIDQLSERLLSATRK